MDPLKDLAAYGAPRTIQAKNQEESKAPFKHEPLIADFPAARNGNGILIDKSKYSASSTLSTSPSPSSFSFPPCKPLPPGSFFVSNQKPQVTPISLQNLPDLPQSQVSPPCLTPLIGLTTFQATPTNLLKVDGLPGSTPPTAHVTCPSPSTSIALSDSKLICNGSTLTSMWIKTVTTLVDAQVVPPALGRFLDSFHPTEGKISSMSSMNLLSNARDLAERGLPDIHSPESPQLDLKSYREEAVKLYLISLDAILTGEKPASSNSSCDSVQVLLTSIPFQKSLMACSLEVVIASYDMLAFSQHSHFPVVMDRLDLQPFELSKVISHFVRHLTSLPKELKRHLFSIEEKIVESLAWLPSSSLYPLLIKSSSGNAQEPPLKRARLENAREGPQDRPTLPLAVGRPNSNPNPSSSASSSPSSQLSIAVLQDFLRKVLKLMSFRLALLLEALDFSPLFDQWAVYRWILEVLEHAVYEQTHLMYNRHIDQVVLASLYGFCKVHKLNQVSFRDIVNLYKKQPQAHPAVYKSVNLAGSGKDLTLSVGCSSDGETRGGAGNDATTGDIISFYNSHFIGVMKPFLLSQVARTRCQQVQWAVHSSPPADPSPTAQVPCQKVGGLGKPPLAPGTRRRSPPGPPVAASQMPTGLAALLSAALDSDST